MVLLSLFLIQIDGFRNGKWSDATEPEQEDRRFIIHGHETEPLSYPSIVRLVRDNLDSIHCGGVLITDLWVLTAAHCRARYAVFAQHSLREGTQYTQGRFIIKTIRHSQYNKGRPFANDIALLKVESPVKLSRAVVPVTILDPQTRIDENATCFIVGWGSTMGTGDASVLREAHVPIMTSQECTDVWAKFHHPKNVTSDQICNDVRYNPSSACAGDSGGPLYCQFGGRNYLAGLTSFGPKGCKRNETYPLPTVFTNVSAYLDWIVDIVKNDYHSGLRL